MVSGGSDDALHTCSSSSVPDRGMEQRSGTSLYLQAHGKCKTDSRDNRLEDIEKKQSWLCSGRLLEEVLDTVNGTQHREQRRHRGSGGWALGRFSGLKHGGSKV